MIITFDSEEELAHALRRAATLHSGHVRDVGSEDEDWPTWYARHIAQEQSARPAGSAIYRHLPDHVDPRRYVASHPTEAPHDPYGGRDTERDFLLRYGGGGDDADLDGG